MNLTDQEYMIENGLVNPNRTIRLIDEAIQNMSLDLSNLTVVTEAASKNFVVTPVIAAKAGARVYAITGDSRYGKKEDIKEFTERFAEANGLNDRIEILFSKDPEIFQRADIVTNLGYVRPITRGVIDMMADHAVIPYMYEAWEYREGDIDIQYCHERNIPVLATNEDAPGLRVFDHVGPLCAKMLFQNEIEILTSRILIVSDDKFGSTILDYLSKMGAHVKLIPSLDTEKVSSLLEDAEVLLVADYDVDELIGDQGQISASELKEINPSISIIQYVGGVDVQSLIQEGFFVFPPYHVGEYRMSMTLAELGPKPVIALHTAGLKVGEIMSRYRKKGYDYHKTMSLAQKNNLCQPLPIN